MLIKKVLVFLLFILLDDLPTVPKYIPKAQVWGDLVNSGIKGAAAIIEDRVRSFVFVSKEISKIKIDKYLQLNSNIESQKSTLLGNIIGLEVVSLELNDLFNELKSYLNKIEEKNKELSISINQTQKTCNLRSIFY